jgi:hypothetical protein
MEIVATILDRAPLDRITHRYGLDTSTTTRNPCSRWGEPVGEWD